MKWTEISVWCIFLYLSLLHSANGQDLNLIPNLLRPYFRYTNQNHVINLMANISEKLFHFKKIGLKFGAVFRFCDFVTLDNV